MTDLEERLRTMLRERAGDVHSVPARVLALPTHRRPARRRTAWLVAAAVVIVVLVAAALAVSGGRHHSAPPPATEQPTRSPSPTAVERAACMAPLPSHWRAAVTAGTARFGARSVLPIGMGDDGRVIATRDFGAARDVVVVDRHGQARRIYAVPQPDTNQVIHASIEGHYAVLDLSRYPRSAVTIIPSAQKVLLVDLRDRSVKTLATAPLDITPSGEQGRTIDGSVLWHGTVYWDVRPHYTAQVTQIWAYSLATGRASVVAHGGPFAPRLVGGGVTWAGYGEDTVSVWRSLPRPVPQVAGLASDGSSYAWKVGPNRISWWGPGQPRPVVVFVPRLTRLSVTSVAGPFVFLDYDGLAAFTTRVIDARTGAMATVTGDLPLMAGGGQVAGYRFTGALKESDTELVRLDTSSLPELHC